MPNKNYRNGYAKELRVKHKLEREGWPLVIRSAGSHGVVDVFAMRRVWDEMFDCEKYEYRFIQCKPKGGYLTPRERQAKAELEQRLGIVVEVI